MLQRLAKAAPNCQARGYSRYRPRVSAVRHSQSQAAHQSRRRGSAPPPAPNRSRRGWRSASSSRWRQMAAAPPDRTGPGTAARYEGPPATPAAPRVAPASYSRYRSSYPSHHGGTEQTLRHGEQHHDEDDEHRDRGEHATKREVRRLLEQAQCKATD